MFDTGTTGFMIVCTMLVVLMTPGLAFFYGGLSRRKNVLNTMFMVLVVMGVVGLAWTIAGWSIAYGGPGGTRFIGGFDQFFLGDWSIFGQMSGDPDAGTGYPRLLDFGFQIAFAFITAGILTGATAGRMKFGALLGFLALWNIFVYAPLAHMVWGGEGSFVGDVIGALDFAGGDVVHIASGVGGLVLCLIVGRRRDYGVTSYRAHNVPFVLLGTTFLWFGWFGFNAGSAFAPDGVATLALATTIVAPCAAMMSWMLVERLRTGKCTVVGACTGVLTGLVVITPAAGFVQVWAAVLMGFIVAPICYYCISALKSKLGYDDALDAFGAHGVGGIVGGILTGIFCVPELSWTEYGGLIYTGDPTLLIAQIEGILVTLVYVVVVTGLISFLMKALFKGELAVDSKSQRTGLDSILHGEAAYPSFDGLD
ncbi:MAG: ammonium transporter [Coriobacteriales bacterium]|nr:ammonium transporter [Coriobacteriales bacterium]